MFDDEERSSEKLKKKIKSAKLIVTEVMSANIGDKFVEFTPEDFIEMVRKDYENKCFKGTCLIHNYDTTYFVLPKNIDFVFYTSGSSCS